MNFSPALATSTAISMTLLASFLWGTWFISVKYLGDYPLDGFLLVLFTTSLILVWMVGVWLDGLALIENIRAVSADNFSRIAITVTCGMLYMLGIRISLHVFQTIGLSLSQPIFSSVNILAGTMIAAIVGGMPEGMTTTRILLACGFFIAAVVASMLAGNLRSRAQTSLQLKSDLRFTVKDMRKSVGLLVLAAPLIPTYSLAISFGLRSVTQPHGLAVLPFMALLSTGAFVGSMATSGVLLTMRKQWRLVMRAPFTTHRFGIMSGLFHSGGNIIHSFATAVLSSSISWPLGLTSGLWTQIWGLVYGEFKGVPKRTYVALVCAICFYLLGAYLIASQAWLP